MKTTTKTTMMSRRRNRSLLLAALLISGGSSAVALAFEALTPDVAGFIPDPDWGGSWYRATLSPANTAAVSDYSVNAVAGGTDAGYCHHYARKSYYGALHHVFVPRWPAQPERHSAVDAAGTLGDAVTGPEAHRTLRCWWMRGSASTPSQLLMEYRASFADHNTNSM